MGITINDIKRSKGIIPKQEDNEPIPGQIEIKPKRPNVFSEFMVEPVVLQNIEDADSFIAEDEDLEPEITDENDKSIAAEVVFKDVLESGSKDEPSESKVPEERVMVPRKPKKLEKKHHEPKGITPAGKGLTSVLGGAKLDVNEAEYEGVLFDEEDREEDLGVFDSLPRKTINKDEQTADFGVLPFLSLDEGVQEVHFKLGIYEISGFLKVEKKYEK